MPYFCPKDVPKISWYIIDKNANTNAMYLTKLTIYTIVILL